MVLAIKIDTNNDTYQDHQDESEKKAFIHKYLLLCICWDYNITDQTEYHYQNDADDYQGIIY